MIENQYKVLFASSEIYPLVKTGGLADVAQSLPRALDALGHEMRLVMPAYREAKSKLQNTKQIANISFLEGQVKLLESTLPDSEIKIWLVDCAPLFDRDGGPYLNRKGEPWSDNAQRFALFSRVIASIAINDCGLSWKPDVIHCNDWQTALAPVLLHHESLRPGIIFTIHNLAYQGIFPYSAFLDLQLPKEYWSFNSLEFHNQLSFIKGGIIYSDFVNTVSPTFASEIQTKEYGFGLEDLLKSNAKKLSGIINGINTSEWNPNTDQFIKFQFEIGNMKMKKKNKLALQQELNFTIDKKIPLLGVVSRLIEQKGIDIIIDSLPKLMRDYNFQLVILGEGSKTYEKKLTDIAHNEPSRVFVHAGYDEELAHRITASSDIFLMPSRFEPCGLNQMYSQRYGTIPIVRHTGGLADTVVNVTKETFASNEASGFVFEKDSVYEFSDAVIRALNLYKSRDYWKKIQRNAMKKDFSWESSAMQYLDLYALAYTESSLSTN